MDKDKRKAVNDLIKNFMKDKDPTKVKIGILSEDETLGKIERMSTGVIGFDVLTDGGLVKGKINQIYGGENAGKTTLIFENISHNQANDNDFVAAYLSAEKTFDRDYCTARGVNPESIVLFEGETAENNTDFCIKCVDSETPISFLAVDTLQALSSKQELYKKDKTRSVEDNSIALLPRVYSQFLRMYTSQSVGKLTLLLASQVRADLNVANPAMVTKKQTGGNAIAHYNVLTVEMKRLGDTNWPVTEIPPNSFVTLLRLRKAKIMNRYSGNTIKIYFNKGSFEHKFNVIAIAKDLGVHDGKTFSYTDSTGQVIDLKYRGFNEMYNKIPDEAVNVMCGMLQKKYTDIAMSEMPIKEEPETLEATAE